MSNQQYRQIVRYILTLALVIYKMTLKITSTVIISFVHKSEIQNMYTYTYTLLHKFFFFIAGANVTLFKQPKRYSHLYYHNY